MKLKTAFFLFVMVQFAYNILGASASSKFFFHLVVSFRQAKKLWSFLKYSAIDDRLKRLSLPNELRSVNNACYTINVE